MGTRGASWFATYFRRCRVHLSHHALFTTNTLVFDLQKGEQMDVSINGERVALLISIPR